MQRLRFDSFDEEKYQKELFEKRQQLRQEPLVTAFLDKHQIKLEDISNLSLFYDYLKSMHECEHCLGLNHCSKEKSGQRMSLDYDGVLMRVCEFCPFALEKQANEKHLKNYVYSDVPSNMLNIFLSEIEVDRNNQDACRLFVVLNQIIEGKFNQGLYIYGSFGTGKTYMCVAFLNELARKGQKVAFLKVNDFANHMRALVINDKDKFDLTLSRIKEVPYLVLDDIGAESTTAFVRDDVLFNLLDYRMEHHLLTLFTSNHSLKTLGDTFLYDKNLNREDIKALRLMERIKYLGSTEFVLRGEDLRFK